MPGTYTFYQDGLAIELSKVDDIIREIFKIKSDSNTNTMEYNVLTWMVLAYETFDVMIKGLQERDTIYKTNMDYKKSSN